MDKSKIRYVLGIYHLLMAIIFVEPFINNGVLPTTAYRTIQLVCVIAIIGSYIRIKAWNNLKKMDTRWLIVLTVIYTIYLFFRYIFTEGPLSLVKDIIMDRTLFAYIVSVIILSLPNRKYLSQILYAFFIGASLTIPLWLLNIDGLVIHNSHMSHVGESIGMFFPFFAGFLLPLAIYFNHKRLAFIWGIWGIYFLLMLLNARRNVSFSLSLYAVVAFAFYTYRKYSKTMTILIVCMSLSVVYCLVSLNWETLTHKTFPSMGARLFEDTRRGVEQSFMKDFKKASIEEWLFGRGIKGTYHQKFYINGKLFKDRFLIETGYLNLILKSGIIYMSIILLLILIGAYRCLRSNNYLIKYIGVFLLTYLIDLYSANPIVPYSVRSILFWFGISIAFSGTYKQENIFGFARLYLDKVYKLKNESLYHNQGTLS